MGNKRYTERIIYIFMGRVDGHGSGGIKCFRVYVACVNKTFCGIFRTGINEQKGMETTVEKQ